MEEWDLYDEFGICLNRTVKRGEPLPPNTYHRIVHIWIYNEFGEFLIQKRAEHLNWFPNKWATTTGSVLSGELEIRDAAYRELGEELGITRAKIDIDLEKDVIIGNSIVSILKGFLPSHEIQNTILNDEVSEIAWMNKTKIDILRKDNNFAIYSDETFEIVYKIEI